MDKKGIIITLIITVICSMIMFGETDALVMGAGDYKSDNIPKLPGAIEDMRRIKKTLIEVGVAGAGASTLSTAGSPFAATTAPATATTTSDCASPGPEIECNFKEQKLSWSFIQKLHPLWKVTVSHASIRLVFSPNEGKTGSVFKTVIATIWGAICEADGQNCLGFFNDFQLREIPKNNLRKVISLSV